MTDFRVLTALVYLLLIDGCISGNRETKTAASNDSVKTRTYASHFRIEAKKDYSLLTISNPWQGADNISYDYYLVKKGQSDPPGIEPEQIIHVPVEKIIAMSTTYLSMIHELNAGSSVVGISGSGLLYNQYFRTRILKGDLADIGYEDNLNKELVIKLDPDLIMVYGVGGESTGYLSKLRDIGMKIMFNADYLEDTPLGKAEWIKVFGALYCKENEADRIFIDITEKYESIRKLVKEKSDNRPGVMLGLPWKDTWFISPGNSYISRLIDDAGGYYLWKDKYSLTSMPYSIENVWLEARRADYWLNISSVNHSGEILNIDSRLADLEPFRKGNLYNNNNRVSPEGGNDYWESGSLYPQVILEDIASILHPELFPGHKLFYYKKIK